MIKKSKQILGACVVLVALVSGVLFAQYRVAKKTIDPTTFAGTLLETPRKIQAFSLEGIDNQPFTNQQLHGQWTFVFFGFTSCGYLCPTTMAELGKMYRILEKEGVSPLPKVVMISIDPDRDSVETLGHYVKAFNPDFYGARGDEARIQAMTHELGIAYAKVALPSTQTQHANQYDVQHSGAVMLFNPQGDLQAFFTTPHQALRLVGDYRLLVS